MHLTANFPRNLLVIFFLNRLRCDRIMVMFYGPAFLARPVYANSHSFSKPVMQHIVNVHCKPYLLYGADVIN